MIQIIKSMTELGQIQDLDVSKCNFDGKFKEIGDLIASNKNLKQLSLQKVGLSDTLAQVLVQPIAEAMNLETLKIDYNMIGSVFMERLCHKISQNLIQQQIPARQGTAALVNSS